MDARENIDQLLISKLEDPVPGHVANTYMTCVEPAFLSTAFGPDYLDGDVAQEHFLEAFRVGGPAARFGVPVD
jgi:hypothetical protein